MLCSLESNYISDRERKRKSRSCIFNQCCDSVTPTPRPVFTIMSTLPITLSIWNVGGAYSVSLLSPSPQEPLCIYLLFLPLTMRRLCPWKLPSFILSPRMRNRVQT